MYRRFYQRLANDRLRRLICGTLLVVLCVGITGFAVPRRIAIGRVGSSAERFPCQSCRCGCASAEFCWDRCCCHSDVEKLRWADDNGVEPPQFLIERVAAAQRVAQLPRVANRAGVPAHNASGPAKPSCCGCGGGSKPPSVCPTSAVGSQTARLDRTEPKVSGTRPPASAAASDPQVESTTLQFVNLESLAKCRGIEMVWTLLTQMIVAGPREVWPVYPQILARLTIGDDSADSLVQLVDPPVPWCV